jgi:hypothetical protein
MLCLTDLPDLGDQADVVVARIPTIGLGNLNPKIADFMAVAV